MTCKDCVHYDVCLRSGDIDVDDLPFNVEKNCACFQNKAGMNDIKELKAENEALHRELACVTDMRDKAQLEKEGWQKKYESLEKQVEFYKGQIEAYQYCMNCKNR